MGNFVQKFGQKYEFGINIKTSSSNILIALCVFKLPVILNPEFFQRLKIKVVLIFSGSKLILFFRLIEIGFFKVSEDGSSTIKEAPITILAPLLTVAVMLIILGLMTDTVMNEFIINVVPKSLL